MKSLNTPTIGTGGHVSAADLVKHPEVVLQLKASTRPINENEVHRLVKHYTKRRLSNEG